MNQVKLECQYCGKVYKTDRGLKNHVLSIHQVGAEGQPTEAPVSDSKLIRCSVCDKTYKTQKNYQKHLLVHNTSEDPNVDVTVDVENTAQSSTSHSCPECKKTFKTLKGLEGHSSTHQSSAADGEIFDTEHGEEDSQDVEGEEGNVSDDDELDFALANDELDSYFIEDEEMEEHLRNLVLNEDNNATKKTTKKKPTKPLVRCEKCPDKKYNSIETYLKHKETHVMEGLFFYTPCEVEIQMKCQEIFNNVLQDMSNSNSAMGIQKAVKDAASVLCILGDNEEFWEILDRVEIGVCDFFKTCNRYLTPAEFRLEFLKSVSSYLCNREERTHLVNELQGFMEISTEAANFLFAQLIRRLGSEMLSFYIHCMINKGEDNASTVPLGERFVITSQSTDTLDFKQTMHFVGGSNVRSLIRSAARIKNPNHVWLRIIDVVKTHFLITELATAPEEELMAWTESVDRGGLIKINAKLLDFFVELGATVKVMEHLDGSLYIDEVVQKVADNSKLVCLWSEILKGSLPQIQSLKLLHTLCNYFCNTWRKGIVGRRLDEISVSQSVGAKHGMGGVAFRSTIQ